jgi:hypothetical protein
VAEVPAAGEVSAGLGPAEAERNGPRFGGARVGTSVRSGGVANSDLLAASLPDPAFESEAGGRPAPPGADAGPAAGAGGKPIKTHAAAPTNAMGHRRESVQFIASSS